TQLNNIPAMTTELKQNKQLSIIEQVREAIKNFPEKRNAMHNEIIVVALLGLLT
ncbi:812_t:CDS:2, partial [Gigaspora rosea]